MERQKKSDFNLPRLTIAHTGGVTVPLATKNIGGPDDYGSLLLRFETAVGVEPTAEPGQTEWGYHYQNTGRFRMLAPNHAFFKQYKHVLAGFLAASRGEKIPTVAEGVRDKIFSLHFLKDIFRGKMGEVLADVRKKIAEMERGASMYQNQ